MVDFDFMRSCLKEKIQAKVVFQVKIRADDTAKKLLSQKENLFFSITPNHWNKKG